MLNILGFVIPLPPGFEFLALPGVAFVLNMIAWIVIALLINFIIMRGLKFVVRKLPGDLEDIILGILRRPTLILFGLYGVDFSLRQLPLLPIVLHWMQTISYTVVVLIITQILGRFIKDVLVYYGEKWAARTETQVDDVLIPVLNLFGPLMLGIIAALIILPMWDVNITSVLLGAGVIGLVLGLALQETLGNIFSGLSLLIEAPFRKGDLILLNDGRISEVVHLGMRSTKLFSLEEQATIFMPNKLLASSMLVNMTLPTPEQRYSIEINIDQPEDLAQVQNTLFRIADGHPAVLSANMAVKLCHVREQVEHIRRQVQGMPEGAAAAQDLLAEADKNEKVLVKLELEGQFNVQVLALKESLRNLIRGINTHEIEGVSEIERQELYCNFVSPAERDVESTLAHSRAWFEASDPWLNDTDFWNQRKVWEKRNEQLVLHWDRLKKVIYQPDESSELRLDDATKLMLEWLEKEYKIPPGYWKNPSVVVKELESTNLRLRLSYYVDNIRLEHDSRPQRVRAELSRLIHEKMMEGGHWG